MKHTIFIVDDEESIRQALRGVLEDDGYKTAEVATGEDALKWMAEEGHRASAVLLDVWLPKMDGIEVLQNLRKTHPDIPVIVLSGHATIDTAVKATKLGAYHFVEKPFSAEHLLLTLGHALKENRLEQENTRLRKDAPPTARQIIGQSPLFLRMMDEIQSAAQSGASVLVLGENGTGKESVAHLIHEQSPRKDGPFVEVNSAAIPEELIESELFGHEAGSFTGATGRKSGKFDQAHQGTLFLDEIGDMSLKTQAKMLRVVQEQRFERVGGNKTIEVDVRVIAATNKNLEEEIRQGNFREDLYYRLAVLPIQVPPLRERVGDVPLLVNHFLAHITAAYRQKPRPIHPDAMAVLTRYHWPGNIRELRNIVERMIIMTRDPEIGVKDIPPAVTMAVSQQNGVAVSAVGPAAGLAGTYREAKEAFERAYITAQLDRHGGNISRTAEAIQMERSNLHKKMKQLGIQHE
ncbi:MAG: sigma-54 dependent transcriptional regulator [Deltaproteobacteria bacterium]|nr:sigma-54 dependent transcriptional regulator [Deltaproteobacteria bacterium]